MAWFDRNDGYIDEAMGLVFLVFVFFLGRYYVSAVYGVDILLMFLMFLVTYLTGSTLTFIPTYLLASWVRLWYDGWINQKRKMLIVRTVMFIWGTLALAAFIIWVWLCLSGYHVVSFEVID